MNEQQRDELAKLLAGHESMGCGCCAYGASTPEQSKAADVLGVSDYMVILADAILAAGYVKAEPVWESSLLNDGVFEYTTTGSCDGTESWHWKRRPRLSYDSGHFSWQKNDELEASA